MKKLTTILAVFTLIGCSNEPKKDKTAADITIESTQKDLDSINDRFERIKELTVAGMSEQDATRTIDSVDNVISKMTK